MTLKLYEKVGGWVRVDRVVNCEGVVTSFKVQINNVNAKLPETAKNDVNYFVQHGKMRVKPKSLDQDEEDALYIVYDKDFGEAYIGFNAPVIVPGSNYDMVGIYCGVEIK
jgi:hypothetical protein